MCALRRSFACLGWQSTASLTGLGCSSTLSVSLTPPQLPTHTRSPHPPQLHSPATHPWHQDLCQTCLRCRWSRPWRSSPRPPVPPRPCPSWGRPWGQSGTATTLVLDQVVSKCKYVCVYNIFYFVINCIIYLCGCINHFPYMYLCLSILSVYITLF